MAGFDWYQATIPDENVNNVLAALSGLSAAPRLRHTKGAHGYGHTTIVEDESGSLARVWHGGTHVYPHVVLSGENTQDGVELIRTAYPDHTVTRVDSREDFGGAETFDRVLPELLDVAKSFRVQVGTAGDHLLTMQGRTVYLGSKSSAVRLRMYDKAAELRAKLAGDPIRLAKVPEHLTRIEAQVRPQHIIARQHFAKVEPMAVMGSSPWLREVWKRVSGFDLEPVQVSKMWRQSDDDRAYSYMLAQYGGMLRRMFEDIGSWDLVGRQIGDDLQARAVADRRAKGSGE